MKWLHASVQLENCVRSGTFCGSKWWSPIKNKRCHSNESVALFHWSNRITFEIWTSTINVSLHPSLENCKRDIFDHMRSPLARTHLAGWAWRSKSTGNGPQVDQNTLYDNAVEDFGIDMSVLASITKNGNCGAQFQQGLRYLIYGMICTKQLNSVHHYLGVPMQCSDIIQSSHVVTNIDSVFHWHPSWKSHD